MKSCSKCKILKAHTDFSKHARHADGLNSQCKSCVSAHKKTAEYREQSRISKRKNYQRPEIKESCRKRAEKFRKSEFGKLYVVDDALRRTYGINLDRYNKMFSDQNGCCAICSKHQSEFSKRLHVDHDHDTGEIRDLLCHHCNTSLGGFGEDVELMKKAIDYLTKHFKKEINIRSIK